MSGSVSVGRLVALAVIVAAAVAAGAKQLEWGWAVLGIGIALVIGASMLGWGDEALETTGNTKRCPFCDKEIVVEAIQCTHCGEILKG